MTEILKSNENTKNILNQTEMALGLSLHSLLELPSIHLLAFLPYLERLINCSDCLTDDSNILSEFSKTLNNIVNNLN